MAEARRMLFPAKYRNLLATSCPNASTMMKKYLVSLDEANIPLDEMLSVAEYAKRAAKLERKVHSHYCTDHQECATRDAKGLNQEVAAALMGAHKDIKSCCLDCMRRNICGIATLTCRLGHPLVPSTVPSLTGGHQSP